MTVCLKWFAVNRLQRSFFSFISEKRYFTYLDYSILLYLQYFIYILQLDKLLLQCRYLTWHKYNTSSVCMLCWLPKNTSSDETGTSWSCLTYRSSGSSKSAMHIQAYVEKCKRYDSWVADRKTVTLKGRAGQQRESKSGWQADSQADRRKAGRQEVWGGRLQREQTAGMLNYHTSVHDMSTLLTTAQRLYSVQSRVRLRPQCDLSGSTPVDNYLLHVLVIFLFNMRSVSPLRADSAYRKQSGKLSDWL